MAPILKHKRLCVSFNALIKAIRVGLSTAVLIGGAAEVHAQSMDYGALEQLFGEPVTTSATGSPQRTTDVPANMEIITQEDIRRSGATDVPGALANVAGVDIQRWTASQTEVGVRGYDQTYSQRLLVLVNGRQVYADVFNYMPWGTLPVQLSEIRQIEVVKGPNAALFGFNAVGGVINIITYDPSHDSVTTASATGGTQNTAIGSAVATFKVGNTAAVRVSGGLSRYDNFSTPVPLAMATGPQDTNTRKTVALDGVIKLTDKVRFRIEANHAASDVYQINPPYLAEFGMYKISSVRGEISADTNVGLLRASAYGTWSTENTNPGPFGGLAFKTNLAVVQLEDTFKLGSAHTLRVSADYRNNAMETTPVSGARVSYEVYSAGGMWEWRIAPPVTVTNAVRADRLSLGRTGAIPAGYPFTNAAWNRSLTSVSFNSGVVWKIGDLDTVRATASRGSLLPNLLNFGGGLFVTPAFGITGIPTADPTVVMNYELGWDRLFPALNARSRIAAFFQRTTDLLGGAGGFIFTPSLVYLTPATLGTSKAAGVELALTGKVHENWRWGLSYRLESVTDRFTSPILIADYEHVTPRHLLKANLGWSDGRWEIDGYLSYQSHTQNLFPGPIGAGAVLVPVPAFASVDGRIGYKLTNHVTVAVSGQNLTNRTQRQTSGPAIERRVLATLTVTAP